MTKTNILLTGPIGTGKTHSLRTVPQSGHRLFVIACEPGIDKILTHSELCHWHFIPVADAPWEIMEDNARKVNTFSNDALQKLNRSNAQNYQQFLEFLATCRNFNCDICGETFGPVTDFAEDEVLAVDSLSGLSVMSMDLVAGGKPIATQPDWGVAMGNLEKLINKLTSATLCSFVLTAHQDREVDEVTGGTKIMVSTLGRKLAPKVPRFFDEVVACRREGSKFFWSTVENNVDLKARRLPFSDSISPDFGPLLGD